MWQRPISNLLEFNSWGRINFPSEDCAFYSEVRVILRRVIARYDCLCDGTVNLIAVRLAFTRKISFFMHVDQIDLILGNILQNCRNCFWLQIQTPFPYEWSELNFGVLSYCSLINPSHIFTSVWLAPSK